MKKNTSLKIIEDISKNKEIHISSKENAIIFILLVNEKNYDGDIKVYIDGKNANVQILGVIIGSGKQEINLYTYQGHEEKESISDLFIKSVLFDESRLAYSGMIKIEKGAQKSNAYQKNQNLLIGQKAWADSRPGLEILANDVRCTHGATIGKINEEEVYYLKTRGIPKNEAIRLIIKGFLGEVVDRIPDERVKMGLKGKIDNKIDALTKN